uniref:Swi5-dependent recombination DNA repair protein 1 homolog n=1 Tax=Mola mola TaxID=94237 RepID=A0A3Q3WQL6_MOLML
MEVTPKAVKPKSPYDNSEESSPCGHMEQKRHQSLSSSLRERLKRSRCSFTLPSSVVKHLCVDDDDDEEAEAVEKGGQGVSADCPETVNTPSAVVPCVDVNRNLARSGSEGISGSTPKATYPSLKDSAHQLRKEVKDKTETLRRLKMVKMYRSNNDLTQLQMLIDKWRSCAQPVLYELQSGVYIQGRKASLSEIIDLFGLDDGILHFDRTEEDCAHKNMF